MWFTSALGSRWWQLSNSLFDREIKPGRYLFKHNAQLYVNRTKIRFRGIKRVGMKRENINLDLTFVKGKKNESVDCKRSKRMQCNEISKCVLKLLQKSTDITILKPRGQPPLNPVNNWRWANRHGWILMTGQCKICMVTKLHKIVHSLGHLGECRVHKMNMSPKFTVTYQVSTSSIVRKSLLKSTGAQVWDASWCYLTWHFWASCGNTSFRFSCSASISFPRACFRSYSTLTAKYLKPKWYRLHDNKKIVLDSSQGLALITMGLCF